MATTSYEEFGLLIEELKSQPNYAKKTFLDDIEHGARGKKLDLTPDQKQKLRDEYKRSTYGVDLDAPTD